MVITVKNILKIAKAERLMTEQPTLSHFFEQTSGNSWELKSEHGNEESTALWEVVRYFNQENIQFTTE